MTSSQYRRNSSNHPAARLRQMNRAWRCLFLILGSVMLSGAACPPSAPATNVIYSHDTTGQVYTVNVDTREATFVGDSNVNLFDIAFDDEDHLFGVSREGKFFLIDKTNATANLIGSTGLSQPNALFFDTELGILWCSTNHGDLATIDRNTGVGTIVKQLTGFGSAGDLTLGTDGKLLLSTNEAELLAIDRDTLEFEDRGTLPSPDMWALERLPDNRLIGITSTNLVYIIDENTAESELQGALTTTTTDFNIRETGGGSFPL